MKKVFISHPFSKNMLINKMNVEKICQEINGVIPISPLHLFSFMKDDKLRNEILKVCFQLIDLCDEVWVYGNSEGCNKEVEYANTKGIKVVVKYGKTEKQNTDTRRRAF
jgi:histidyl-tRNA synthetase